jgi:hypothetical protein
MAIKHLKPFTEAEIEEKIKDLSLQEKLSSYCEVGYFDKVRECLQDGAYPAWDDCYPLLIAATEGNQEIVSLLMKDKNVLKKLNAPQRIGQNQIHLDQGFAVLSRTQFAMLESFIQYGNPVNAKYIFVGLEEELNNCESYELSLNSRLNLMRNFPYDVGYIHTNKYFGNGWFLKDPATLENAYRKENESISGNVIMEPRPVNDMTLNIQKRIFWLMENRLHFADVNNQDFSNRNLLSNNINTSLVSYFPFPKNPQSNIVFKLEGVELWNTSEEYYNYFLTNDTLRKKILIDVYDTFPLNISFVYAGIKEGKFILRDFYTNLGFIFEEKFTDTVHPDYAGIIAPTQVKKRKKFLIGHRNTLKGVQHAILTPFFGEGQLTDNDIDVIASWVPKI